MTSAISDTGEPETGYFGGCPTCRKDDGFLNVGTDHYFICREHQVYWCAGANLFSCWQEEDENIWQQTSLRMCRHVSTHPLRHRELLGSFTAVEPYCDPGWDASDDQPFARQGSRRRHHLLTRLARTGGQRGHPYRVVSACPPPWRGDAHGRTWRTVRHCPLCPLASSAPSMQLAARQRTAAAAAVPRLAVGKSGRNTTRGAGGSKVEAQPTG